MHNAAAGVVTSTAAVIAAVIAAAALQAVTLLLCLLRFPSCTLSDRFSDTEDGGALSDVLDWLSSLRILLFFFLC